MKYENNKKIGYTTNYIHIFDSFIGAVFYKFYGRMEINIGLIKLSGETIIQWLL